MFQQPAVAQSKCYSYPLVSLSLPSPSTLPLFPLIHVFPFSPSPSFTFRSLFLLPPPPPPTALIPLRCPLFIHSITVGMHMDPSFAAQFAAQAGYGMAAAPAAAAAPQAAPAAAPGAPAYCLFVFNLPADADEGLLYRLFGPFGAISDVKIMRDATTNQCKVSQGGEGAKLGCVFVGCLYSNNKWTIRKRPKNMCHKNRDKKPIQKTQQNSLILS